MSLTPGTMSKANYFSPTLQHNCDPQFFTTVVFYTGSVSHQMLTKFEVFDVYNRHESKVGVVSASVSVSVVFLTGAVSLP